MDDRNWEVHLKPNPELCFDTNLYAGRVVKKFKGSETQMKNFIRTQIKSGLYLDARFIHIL